MLNQDQQLARRIKPTEILPIAKATDAKNHQLHQRQVWSVSRNLIINWQKVAHKAGMTLEGFGAAMAQLDLASVPEEKRGQAIMDHMMRIAGETILDPTVAKEVRILRFMHDWFHRALHAPHGATG